MSIKQIRQISWLLILPIFCLFAGSAFLIFFSEEPIVQERIGSHKKELPKSSFPLSSDLYVSLGDPILFLTNVTPRLHLPDLKQYLVFCGKNGRPDAAMGDSKMLFAFAGAKQYQSIQQGEKYFLTYDKTLSPCKYTFSPENKETLLWFVANLEGNEAKITLEMKDKEGNIISQGDAGSQFYLPEKESTRQSAPSSWDMGTWRVDGTLLARQKARWVGVDKFLEQHGGDEFSPITGKHRVDFGEGEDCYSVYVALGDCLSWDKDQWKAAVPGKETLNKPIMVVKRVEDRVMMLEIWDNEGKAKVGLNLIRSPENFVAQPFVNRFKFVGARTKTQVVFEIDQKRMMMKPNDWLVMTDEGWKKIKSAQDVDDYVNRKIVGPLFVFEEIMKKEDKPVLVGKLFNPNRTEVHPIEVVMSTNSHPQGPGSTPGSPVLDKPNIEQKTPVTTPVASHH